MDDWLDERGLYRKNTALDGSCLFRAVAEQLIPANPINGHIVLRKQCVVFLRNNKYLYQDRVCGDFEEYVEAVSQSKGWGTTMELDVISRLYHVDFLCFYGPEAPLKVTNNGHEKELMLCVTDESFFDAIYPKKHIENLGFCQSIVYHILYEDVFQLEDVDYAVNKMLYDREARFQRERYLAHKTLERDDVTFDSYLEEPAAPVDVRKVLDSGAILFPYKVAKALEANTFRNVEFDNWIENQRGLRRNSFFAQTNSRSLRTGSKCLIRIDGRPLTAFIQDMSPQRGPAVVFIEQLAQRLVVPYEDLLPLPRFHGWSYTSKKQMIRNMPDKDNGGSDDRKSFAPRTTKSRRSDASITSTSNINRQHSQLGDQYGADLGVGLPFDPMRAAALHRTVNHNNEWYLVQKDVAMSVCPDGSDLPHHLPTVRFYYNMGLEYFQQGTYIQTVNTDEIPAMSEDRMPTVQLCQGTPIIQPPPVPMQMMQRPPILVNPIPPPLPMSPIMHPPCSMPMSPILHPPYPMPMSPIVHPPSSLPMPMPLPPIGSPISELVSHPPPSPPFNSRPSEARGKSKFNKPPRFLRQDRADQRDQRVPFMDFPHNLVQVAEVSSSEEQGPHPLEILYPGHGTPDAFILTDDPDSTVYYQEGFGPIYPFYPPSSPPPPF